MTRLLRPHRLILTPAEARQAVDRIELRELVRVTLDPNREPVAMTDTRGRAPSMPGRTPFLAVRRHSPVPGSPGPMDPSRRREATALPQKDRT